MAVAADNDFLIQATIYLGATAVAVPIFKKLKLGTILGFLAAGMILGPYALGWLHVEEGVFHIAELGVVLFLFVIGLELSFARLWSLRTTIFGLGLLQMAITGSVFGYGLYLAGWLTMGPAMVAGFALACSSTAFALSLLQERRELNTPYGTKAFSILLFQDLAVIPLLAAIPIVAAMSQGDGEAVAFDLIALLQATGAILAIVVLGKYPLNWFFRIVAVSGSREAFTAAALFVVAGISLGMTAVGLSMALGAFLAGVVLAESSFRHQIESDIEPFRELLLGLFFIGVGMQLNLNAVFDAWWIVLAGAAGLILSKMVIIFALAKTFRSQTDVSLKAAAILSQGGEFGFVVFSLGAGQGLFNDQLASLLPAIVTVSMVATPIIMAVIQRISFDQVGEVAKVEDHNPTGSVLVVGFGRIGQAVTQVVRGSGIEVIAIDNDPKRIEVAAQFGAKVYFGDGTNVNLLVQAGAMDADVIVFASDDRETLGSTIKALRERCPKVKIIARAYDRIHEIELMDVDADLIVREMFESSMLMAENTLKFIGLSDGLIEDICAEFRERDRERLLIQKAEGLHAHKEKYMQPLKSAEKVN